MMYRWTDSFAYYLLISTIRIRNDSVVDQFREVHVLPTIFWTPPVQQN